MFRKALLVLSGNAAASLLLLARNLIVARLIPVEDYGVAATFAVAMAVVEMASAFGLQQQIVQAKEGDDPYFQAVLQGFQLLRGVASGAILFFLAGPLGRFMGIPEVIWAYQVLAVVPVLNALVHFDIHRLNRQMRFGPLIITGVLPAVISLVLIWPLVHWFGDWQVMLWAILAQAIVTAATSHLVAERPWRLAFDRTIIAGSVRFGWPLLANGILMFLVFQGDKLIVGRVMGMETLAIFAMGVTLTLTPTLVLAKSVQNLFLPKLSMELQRENLENSNLRQISGRLFAIHYVFGDVLVWATVIFGAIFIEIALGAKYAPLQQFLLFMAIQQSFRLFKGGPSTLALAHGRTSSPMIANLARVAFLPLGYVLAIHGNGLETLLFVALFAEATSFLVALFLVRQSPGLSINITSMLSSLSFQFLVFIFLLSELSHLQMVVLSTIALVITSLSKIRELNWFDSNGPKK